jgi:hypothetical protein
MEIDSANMYIAFTALALGFLTLMVGAFSLYNVMFSAVKLRDISNKAQQNTEKLEIILKSHKNFLHYNYITMEIIANCLVKIVTIEDDISKSMFGEDNISRDDRRKVHLRLYEEIGLDLKLISCLFSSEFNREATLLNTAKQHLDSEEVLDFVRRLSVFEEKDINFERDFLENVLFLLEHHAKMRDGFLENGR